MQPEEVSTTAQARAIVEERGLQHVKIGIFDNDGILRGKYIGREKFFAALEKGIGFCDVVLGWDSNDQQYDNITFTGWHTAFPDAPVRLLPHTCRALPFEGNMLLFLGEFAGQAEEICPRATLRRVLGRAAAAGYGAAAAAEYEFFLFSETPASVRDKGYRGLSNLTPGLFRLFGAAQLGARRALSGAAAARRRHAHADRRAAHRDRPGRHRGRAALHRGAGSRRSRRAVQDLRQGARPAPRPDGDFHGEVVAAAAGAERPPARVADAQRRRVRVLRCGGTAHHVRRRCAGSSAGSRR